ncbi:uncharacterized protein A1O5_06503 [Cladophialophora psammophila CBS 110553]|uniref:FAD-binding domain-containing protein n=1 Tax=Cladophialophora psammophila CBS 110553 TaxID=1182543 RepID=W9WZF7_9EURO|nr:uncharacterized protein A1O5_06503 [Cladophialophora psammophila CBS 110553]EXJ70435.1 hypothetical protein A1O5_06503 [Cladophialophora psammophila CBS 110553]
MAAIDTLRSDATSANDNHATVLIIGAGVVGCLTAIKLAQAGIDVQIVERLLETSEAPRACGYFGAVQGFLDELGLYTLIRDQGFMTRGLCWRGLPKDNDSKDGKRFGDIVAVQPLCAPDDTSFPVGSGLLNLTQGQLNKLFVHQALQTGRVRVNFGAEFVSILENSEENGVTVLARDVDTGVERQYRGKYCIGADGAHSNLRKALGLPFPGHQWPERLLATNVRVPNVEDPVWHTYYYMAEKYWGVATPLEEPVLGEKTLWRYAIAVPPEVTKADDELLSDEYILGIYESRLPGPRPLQAQIEARVLYRIHQRLAPTLRKGNCLLAGDAAHVCNPVGALGLNSGMLDADALAEALVMVLREGRSDKVLDVYSDERRKVFQFFVDPTSSQNKMRVHSHPPETAAQDDWYFRILANNPTKKQMLDLMKPYFETWRTNMRKAAGEL